MKLRSLTGASIVGMVISVLTGSVAAQEIGACPTAQIMTPAEIAARWDRTRAQERREGLIRTVDLAFDWRRTSTYVIERVNQNGSNDVSTVRQAGQWRRIDQTHGPQHRSEYINLETGVRVVIRRSAYHNHSDTIFEATRPRAADDWRRWRRVGSGRREMHIGERCTVSRFDPVEARRDLERPTQPTEVCRTDDGIELWRRTASPPGVNRGEPLEFFVTTSLSREHVALEDVRPPRDMLAWDYWRERADDRAPAFAPSDSARPIGEPDHTICFQGRADLSTKEIRVAGQWRYTQQGTGAIWIAGPGLQIALQTDEGGQPWSLTARVWRPTQLLHSSLPEFGDADRSATILGEHCVWQTSETVVDNALPASWCIAADGVTLATSPPHLEATALRRGALSAEAFQPPELAFAWIDPR
jgi:hypothetical protein